MIDTLAVRYSSMPHYRIRIEIYDDEAGETIVTEDQPLMSTDDDNATNVYRALKKFNKEKEEHEAIYYPTEEEEVL